MKQTLSWALVVVLVVAIPLAPPVPTLVLDVELPVPVEPPVPVAPGSPVSPQPAA